jgi:DNA-binding FadR family transcriptional regulator
LTIEPLLRTNSSAVRQRYEQIADLLLADLRRGVLQAGERLPGERQLAEHYGVGRASIREALAALVVRGLVQTRQGAGSFFVADALERLARADDGGAALAGAGGLGLPADAGPAAVLEARRILEPEIVALAARRASADPEIEALLTIMEDNQDPSDPQQRRRWSDADRRFHRQFAVATANPVLLAIADHLAELMDQPLWQQLRDESIAVPGRTTLQLAEHRLIAAAVTEGDADGARLNASRHIDRARRYMALD